MRGKEEGEGSKGAMNAFSTGIHPTVFDGLLYGEKTSLYTGVAGVPEGYTVLLDSFGTRSGQYVSVSTSQMMRTKRLSEYKHCIHMK